MVEGVLQAGEVADLVTLLQRLAVRLDPDALPDGDVAGVLTDLGQVKRLVDGMVALVARRSIDVQAATTADGLAISKAARDQVATATGSTPAEARRLLDTSVRLRDQPQVADAVKDGRLSGVQVEAVAGAAAAAPDRTVDLLDAAARQSVHDLKRTCRDTRAAADPDPAATRRRHHARRGFRAWHESDGEWKAFLSGPADAGARIEALIRHDHDLLFRAAHAERRVEPDAALRFDALLQALGTRSAHFADGACAGTSACTASAVPGVAPAPGADADEGSHTGKAQARGMDEDCPADPTDSPGGTPRPRRDRGRGRQTQVIVRVDATALKRGTATADETCEIAGIGRVPVDAVRELIPDAHIAYVIADAVDAAVVHLGRQVTAHQRTALLARGYECEVPDCRSSHLLEIDHVRDWAISRQTQLDQLAWLCRRHHKDKTHGTHRLTGPPGDRRWLPAAHVAPTGDPPCAPGVGPPIRAASSTSPASSRSRASSTACPPADGADRSASDRAALPMQDAGVPDGHAALPEVLTRTASGSRLAVEVLEVVGLRLRPCGNRVPQGQDPMRRRRAVLARRGWSAVTCTTTSGTAADDPSP
jgi:hypothetical protein